MFLRLVVSALVLHLLKAKVIYDNQICSEVRRMFLEPGERGTLTAKSENKSDIFLHFGSSGTSQNKCVLELITCPSCVIVIKFTFLNITRNCAKESIIDSCGCDYVWIYEPPYEDVSGEQFCGHYVENINSGLVYKSRTRNVGIKFLFSNVYDHAFSLEYSSERNRIFLSGSPKCTFYNNESKIIMSPFFPSSYPRDLSIEYVIKCRTSEKCRVRLIFSDFLIDENSLIEFFDWNGQRMDIVTGFSFRPPVVISFGPTLVVRFYANGGTNLGYKASYSFLVGDYDNSTMKPHTDCGGSVDNLGGSITMMNMVVDGTKSYDCFWIIQPPKSYLHFRTNLYLKVVAFSDFGGNTDLIIRQGLTSIEAATEILRYPNTRFFSSKQKEHVVSIFQGFYVSLRGIFRMESRIAIVYSAFSYKECLSGSEFLCKNRRCISSYLRCDGFDHCGDNSDESPDCFQEPQHRKWSNTPNFYFPKIDRYSDLRVATVVFTICSFGLIALIISLIILLYRIKARARRQRGIDENLQGLNYFQDDESPVSFITVDEPPIYEAPPDYNELIQVVEDVVENQKRVRKRNSASSSRSASRRRSCNRCSSRRRESRTNTSSSGTNVESSSLMSVAESSSTSCQLTLIPDSPPPSYVFATSFGEDNRSVLVDLTEHVNAETTADAEELRLLHKRNLENMLKLFSQENIHILNRRWPRKLGKSRISKLYSKTKSRKTPIHFSDNNMFCCLSDSELLYLNDDSSETGTTRRRRELFTIKARSLSTENLVRCSFTFD